MIIDFHTHTFPAALAKKALSRLASAENLTPFTDGTNRGLLASMEQSGTDISILLPVATKPEQVDSINANVIALDSAFLGTGLLSFGAIHPDTPNPKEVLSSLKNANVPGIKLHPIFQKVYLDDPRYLRIIDLACDLGLIISVHAGRDITWPDATYASTTHIKPVLRDLRPPKFILAHMGSWNDYDAAEELLAAYPTWLDTSFTLPQGNKEHFFATDIPPLLEDQFLRILKNVGADHVLFGTDSPWTGQKENLQILRSLPLPEPDLQKILGQNALGLLKSSMRFPYNVE